MATIEIIELENEQIQNKLCSMKFTKIYEATGATNIKHVWNTITFAGSQLIPVEGANSACATGQCEQRPLEIGECVIYKNGNVFLKATVLAISNNNYDIGINNYADKNSPFVVDHGIKEELYELKQTVVKNVQRVNLKTVNYVVKITDSEDKKTLYYTDFLDTTKLIQSKIVSKTLFVNLETHTYLPFWCEPAKGFIAAPTDAQSDFNRTQLAWTHYMDWCRDLHLYIKTQDEAFAAYMYTYVKVEPINAELFFKMHSDKINVEQTKILKILEKTGFHVPNPPMIYMRRRQYNATPLFQIHNKETETQQYIKAARTVTQRIIENQHFPFVCIYGNTSGQFDNWTTFNTWLQRSATNILMLTDNVEHLRAQGFVEQNSNVSNSNNKNIIKKFVKNGKTLHIANIFGIEACKKILSNIGDWWEDKGFYYVNYGNNYEKYYGIKPFISLDKCELKTKRGGDENAQTGGAYSEQNSLCIQVNTSTASPKFIIFNPTTNINVLETIEWSVLENNKNVVTQNLTSNLTGTQLQNICKQAHAEIIKKYNIDRYMQINNIKNVYNILSPDFSIIFIKEPTKTKEIGIKNYIDNVLKINETEFKNEYDDFAINILVIIENGPTYWGYLNIKRMEISSSKKGNVGVTFIPPLRNNSTHISFDDFNKNQQNGGIKNNCQSYLQFNDINDYNTLLTCLQDYVKKQQSSKPIRLIELNNSTNKMLYENAKKMIEPFITTIDYKPIINERPVSVDLNLSKSTVSALTLNKIIQSIQIIIDAYNTLIVNQPVAPVKPQLNLSQLEHYQITLSVCNITNNSDCYHKAYIKSLLPKSINHASKELACQNVLQNVKNIYEATRALYAYKNDGYSLVKLVDGHEHDYFNKNPEGFVKQATNKDATQKVVEYELGDTPPSMLEDIIETSELINSIGYADGLDVAFLASNPDATDMENMAMLRNGINYNQ